MTVVFYKIKTKISAISMISGLFVIILKHLNYYNHNRYKITYKESVVIAIIVIKNYR